MKKNKKSKSFVGDCVLYFSIYSCILIASILFINLLVDTKIKKVIPSIDDILSYEEYLVEDKFNKIPLNKFKKNEIIIFDELKNVIFRTNNFPDFTITSFELDYINDYYSDYYYTVKEYINEKNKKEYFISKNTYNEDEDYESLVDYVLLDENLNIVKGNLFKGRKKLSECELELINGYASNNSFIEKYRYYNSKNEERTLVFLDEPFDEMHFEKKLNHIYSMWLYLIPLIAFCELVMTYIFFQKIKKMVSPIQDLMDNYENIAIPNFDDEKIPWEFNSLFKSFKNLIQKLNTEKSKSERIYREKQSLIANISHDLKTPLTVIKGYAKALNDDIVPVEKREKYISAIYNKSEIATNIIDSLFSYTQMEHPDFKSNFEELDFNEFCREYLAIKYVDLELQNYKLEFELLNKPLIKSFDSKLMTRLFDNIINNSVKHNEKKVTIYFKLKKIKDKVKIILADDGKGIDKNNNLNLFNAFITGDEARNNGSGTGLGLFIAKRVVEIHDGKIKLIKKPKSPYKFAIEIEF